MLKNVPYNTNQKPFFMRRGPYALTDVMESRKNLHISHVFTIDLSWQPGRKSASLHEPNPGYAVDSRCSFSYCKQCFAPPTYLYIQ